MKRAYFITGTDTGVGKTMVSCALLRAFANQGFSSVGMKPVAAGCAAGPDGLMCDDVENLMAAGSVAAPRRLVNPYAFEPPIAPHLAAAKDGVVMDIAVLLGAFRALCDLAEMVVVEGVGGFRVPLDDRLDTSDLAATFGLPVILVVGMRLGCLNHALLTAEAIRSRGLTLAGWVANAIDADMLYYRENRASLEERLNCPCIADMPHFASHQKNTPQNYLNLDKLM